MNRFLKYALSLVLCVLFTVYLLYHLLSGLGEKTALFTVSADSFDEVISGTGFLFRDAEIVASSYTGAKQVFVSDGEKVPAGKTVAVTYPQKNPAVSARIAEIDREIGILGKSKLSGTETVAELDDRIARVSETITGLTARGETATLASCQDELAVLTNQRLLLTGSRADFSAEIVAREREKDQLLSRLGSVSETVTVPCSGWFYSYADGLDSLFTPSLALSLDTENFKTLETLSPVAVESTVGVLVKDAEWFFALTTTDASASEILVGKTYACRFTDRSDSRKIPMTVEKKVDGEDGTVLLVLSTRAMPEGFSFARRGRIEITVRTHTGYKIPSSSLRIESGTGRRYVYIFKKGFAASRTVTPLFEKDGYTIVKQGESLGPLDRIIVGMPDLYDGKRIP